MAADGEWEALPPPTGGGTWAQPGALTTDKRGYVYWSAKDYGGTGGFAIFQAIDGVTDRRAREAHNEADEDAVGPTVAFVRGIGRVSSLCTTPGGWLCACQPEQEEVWLYSRSIPRSNEAGAGLLNRLRCGIVVPK